MNLLMHNQALLRGILAGAVVLSGVSACSRDRASSTGSDTTQSGSLTPSDSQTSARATQPSAGVAAQPAGDTAVTPAGDTAASTTAQTPAQGATPSDRDTTVKSGEESASGYQPMERDTSVSAAASDTASAELAGAAASPMDSAGVTSDYALTGDTTTAGNSEMARDTSSAAGQGDTSAVAVTDTTTQAGSDTANIQVAIDTTTAQANADTTATGVRTDTLTVATPDAADTTSALNEQDNAGRIRPPEDSTEILGNVTGDTTGTANDEVATQSESERIRPPEDSTEISGNVTSDDDSAEVASRDAQTDSVGAAAVGPTVTGIDAVAVMSRAGERCVVKDDSNEVAWDMADSPAALNPCGTGTMTLSRVRTGEK